MAIVTPPYADPGRAAFQELDTFQMQFLLAGPHPELKPAFGFPLPFNANYPQFQVVGLNGSGELVPANATTVKAIGILAHAAQRGASPAPAVNGQVWYSGCFNIDALVWDGSFTTDALKEAAFRGSPTPTNVIATTRD